MPFTGCSRCCGCSPLGCHSPQQRNNALSRPKQRCCPYHQWLVNHLAINIEHTKALCLSILGSVHHFARPSDLLDCRREDGVQHLHLRRVNRISTAGSNGACILRLTL